MLPPEGDFKSEGYIARIKETVNLSFRTALIKVERMGELVSSWLYGECQVVI